MKKYYFVLFVFFLCVNLGVYFFTQYGSQNRIDLVLQEDLDKLQIHYDVLNTSQKNIAYAISQSIIKNTDLIKFLSTSYTATDELNNKNREILYNQLKEQYKTAKKQGVLQLQFVNRDNISFLRVHKPSKFGDDLTSIREDYKIVNTTKEPIRGFTQGRTAHGFRNTFPLFDENNVHIGAMEISFSSEKYQWYLNNVSNIHSHFLVDKKIFDAKTWEAKDLVIKYQQAAEDKHYMLYLSNFHSHQKCIVENDKKLESYRELIHTKTTIGEKFNFYVKNNKDIEIISFLPIKNLSNKTVAWIVSHTKSDIIKSSLESIFIIRIVTFFVSLYIVYLLLRQFQSKRKLEDEKKRFQYILENATDGIHILDNKGNILMCSDSFAEMLGYTKEEILKLNVTDWDVGISKEKLILAIQELFDNPHSFKTKHKRKDGSVFDVEINAKGIELNKKIYLYGSSRDITSLLKINNLEQEIKKATNKLVLQNEILHQTQELAKIGYWKILYPSQEFIISDSFRQIYGVEKDQSYTIEDLLLTIHKDDRLDVQDIFTKVFQNPYEGKTVYRINVKDEIRHIEVSWNLVYQDGEVIAFQGYSQNITEKVKAQQKLEESYHSLQKFIETQDNIVLLSQYKELVFANKKFFEFFGYKDLDEFKLHHKCICELFIENDRFFHLGMIDKNQNWLEELLKLEHSKRVVSMMGKNFKVYAFSVSINDYDKDTKILSFADISQTMLQSIELENKVIHDKLTGAYNREYFEQNYQNFINEYHSKNTQLGIALLDIDHFKSVNDTYGHDVGDTVLVEFVKTIQKYSRKDDVLVRWGGEEFILILKVESIDNLQKALEHLRKVIEMQNFPTIGQKTCSIGGTIYIANEDIETTIKRADKAVYDAKENGRNKVVIK